MKILALYQGGDETSNGKGPARVQFRGGCKMTRAVRFIMSVAALLFFFLDEMLTLLPGNMALQCALV